VVSGGAGPVVVAVGAAGEGPAGVVFQVVVPFAERFDVDRAGRTVGPRCAVVELAVVGASAAAGQDAALVAGDDVPGDRDGWCVGVSDQ